MATPRRFVPLLAAAACLLGALLACKLPGGSRDAPAGGSASPPLAPDGPAPDLGTASGITVHADRIDCAVGKGSVRVTEAHNAEGMGSSVIVFEIEEKIVKILRRTELGPPTVTTGFYFANDALVLAETRITDQLAGSPVPAPDRRYYAAGRLLHRAGKPASDTDPDTKRTSEDHVVAQALLAGARERLPGVRLPEGVW